MNLLCFMTIYLHFAKISFHISWFFCLVFPGRMLSDKVGGACFVSGS